MPQSNPGATALTDLLQQELKLGAPGLDPNMLTNLKIEWKNEQVVHTLNGITYSNVNDIPDAGVRELMAKLSGRMMTLLQDTSQVQIPAGGVASILSAPTSSARPLFSFGNAAANKTTDIRIEPDGSRTVIFVDGMPYTSLDQIADGETRARAQQLLDHFNASQNPPTPSAK